MHSLPAASVATAGARAATLRPQAAVGRTDSSEGTESEPSCVTPSLAPSSTSLAPPPCVALFLLRPPAGAVVLPPLVSPPLD